MHRSALSIALLAPILLAPILLVGCATPQAATAPAAEPVPEATKQVMEAKCGAAVAEHIGAPLTAVLPVWSGATPDNRGLVTVGDRLGGQQRIHFCETSATGQVYAIRHSL